VTQVLHKTPETNAWRGDIDGLRAFAVLSVMLHHYFPSAVRGGFIGVDVFFVISGFLIGGILLDAFAQNRFSLLDFYARRARRILPALLLVLLTCLALGGYVLLPDDYGNLGKHTAGGAGFVSNLLLYGEAGYFDNAAETKILLHLWSLGVEEQFYLVFPLFLWMFAAVAAAGPWREKTGRTIVVGIVLLAVLSFGWNLAVYKSSPDFDFYMPMTRFWELFAGVLLAAGKPWWAGRSLAVKNWLSVLGFLLLLYALLKTGQRHFPGVVALMPVLGAVLLIATGMRGHAQEAGKMAWFNRLLAWKPLAWVGLISYPLYLWHWPLLSFARIILGEMPAAGLRWALMALAVVLAWGTCKLVERPLRFGRRPGLKAIALGVALVLTGLIGWGVSGQHGSDPVRQQDKTAPALTDEACLKRHADLRRTLIRILGWKGGSFQPYCRYVEAHDVESDTQRTVVVWGDSHAQTAFEAIAAYNAGRGVNTWLIGRSGFRNIPGKSLPAVIDAIGSAIDREPQVHSIFLVLVADSAKNPAQARRIYQPIIDRMNRMGKRVFIVADNPELPFSPRILEPGQPLRVQLHALQGTSASRHLFKADMLRKQEDYLAALSQLSGATVIPSVDAFCPTDECLLFDEEGNLLYRDMNHLSRYSGGRFLVNKVLKPYLDDIAGKQP
jgi:peptidoglycan/LPS O-acetylase OafA/YrhL